MLRFFSLSFVLIVVAGCGFGRVTVSGTVQYPDGSAVLEGNINGELEGGGREMIQANITNGTFKFASIPQGKYKIMIQCRALGDSELSEGKRPAIDSKFGSYSSSGLTLDATTGKSDIQMTVTKPDPKK